MHLEMHLNSLDMFLHEKDNNVHASLHQCHEI